MSGDKIKFKYEIDPSATPVFAGGMMTAPSPDGKVLLRFFCEVPSMPATETWRTENGQLVERVEADIPDAQITRRVVAAVLVDQNTLAAMTAAINQQLSNMRNGGNPPPSGMPPPGFRR